MAFELAPGISFCDPGGRHVFLDLAADRYFCLSDAAEETFARLVDGAPLDVADHSRLSILETQGLLRSVPGAAGLAPCQPAAPIQCSLAQRRSGAPLGVLLAVVSLARAKSDVRRVPLARLIQTLEAAKLRSKPHASQTREQLERIGAAFSRAAVMTNSLNECLAVSIAIVRRAIARGIDAQLVLGVKLRPFQAHAWAQVGPTLISDQFDTVACFTPILVV
jgi:hypothetical protein